VVHQELKRKGMTKQLLWEEYTAAHPTIVTVTRNTVTVIATG
jgi:transposase